MELEEALKADDLQYKGSEKYLQGIGMIRQRIGKVRTLGAKYIQTGAKEIEYFRNVWPAFYSKLFLYIRLYGVELRRDFIAADAWQGVMKGEERIVQTFFDRNREFWQYYRSGAPSINEQFTRAYSVSRIFEPLSIVMDQDGATLASYRAARCLELYAYGEWLRDELASSWGSASAADLGYSFGSTDADLAEWLFGLQAVGGILYKGQAADISRLQKWARLAVGKEVANIYDRGRVLRNRKKERLAFTKKIASALEKKWDQAEGKYE